MLKMNEEVAHRNLLIGKKVIELRNLVTLAYKVKCEQDNQLKTIDMRLEESKNEIVRRIGRL